MILWYVILLALVLLWFIFYIAHISMVVTEDDCNGWSFSTFNNFIKCYNSRSWHKTGKSLFDDNSMKSFIGYSCIYFDNHGMILDPISFIFYAIWSIKALSNNSPRKFVAKYEWK
jgi:hypothetical protein